MTMWERIHSRISSLPHSVTARDSGAVFRVDLYVFVGQVGGPDGFAAITTAQLDADGDFFFSHHCRALLFGVGGCAAALAGDAHSAQEHVDLADVQVWHAGATYGSQDTAPVRIGRKQRGLDQWRVGHGVADIQAFLVVTAAVDFNGHELGRTFAVTDDGLGHFYAHFKHRLLERCEQRALGFGNFRQCGLTSGDQHAAVVGRGVAIDGNAVERLVGAVADQVLQHALGNLGVGGDVAKHGRHVRPDHACAFADARYGDGHAIVLELAAGT